MDKLADLLLDIAAMSEPSKHGVMVCATKEDGQFTPSSQAMVITLPQTAPDGFYPFAHVRHLRLLFNFLGKSSIAPSYEAWVQTLRDHTIPELIAEWSEAYLWEYGP